MEEKTVTLLGTGPTAVQCPYDDSCGEIWGVNGAYQLKNTDPHAKDIFRMDKLFLTHTLFREEGVMNFDVEAMGKLGCPIISLHRIRWLKTQLYPYKRITKKFGTEFFTSSIGYMLAYALDKKYTNLKLYGIDMVTRHEYWLEKGGVEFWLGYHMGINYAAGRGAGIFIAPGSAVMVPQLGVPYGKFYKVKYDLKVVDPYGLLKGNMG